MLSALESCQVTFRGLVHDTASTEDIGTFKLRFTHRKTAVKEFEWLTEIRLINSFNCPHKKLFLSLCSTVFPEKKRNSWNWTPERN